MGRLGMAVRTSSKVATEEELRGIRGVLEESKTGLPEASIQPSLFRVSQS